MVGTQAVVYQATAGATQPLHCIKIDEFHLLVMGYHMRSLNLKGRVSNLVIIVASASDPAVSVWQTWLIRGELTSCNAALLAGYLELPTGSYSSITRPVYSTVEVFVGKNCLCKTVLSIP